MPSLKSKNKAKDSRQSRSRNTTPGSVVNVPVSSFAGAGKLEIPIQQLMIPANVLYEDLLERHGSNSGIPDARHLDILENDLRTLAQLAEARDDACSGAMRALSKPWKERIEEERELAQAEDKAGLKRAAAEDEDVEKVNRSKQKKRKDQRTKEERPLAHGAHGVARQDGVETLSPKGQSRASPSNAKLAHDSGSSSSLSPPSQAQSPVAPARTEAQSTRASPAPSSSSEGEHQPRPAASVPSYQTFGPNPVEFDDPTVYHVRDVTDDMPDDEKREIYNVAVFPKSNLYDLIAGLPPDKDFSNAKPSNQVNANTFAAYLEPYFRPLTEEDISWLRERGDRVTPSLMPRRNTKSYQQIWAEEDGAAPDNLHREKYPANQPRGSIEQMDDDVAETDKVSTGPMLARLLSLMRHEQRPEAGEKANGLVNGEAGTSLTTASTNGDSGTSTTLEPNKDDTNATDTLPPATQLPGSDSASWKNTPVPKMDYATVDERLKQELRYIGFLAAEVEPDYDAHADDEVAQRLRVLQAELRDVMILNGARKARLLAIAEEHMGYQEYATIREDLDGQVNSAFQKRTRSLGKGKKHAKKPGASHAAGAAAAAAGAGAAGSAGAGLSRPGIGDAARALMDRRRRWMDTIGPIFSEDITTVRGADDSVFSDEVMAPYIAAEKERLEEEEAG